MENIKPQLLEKQAKVGVLKEDINNAAAVLLTDYRGITVDEDTKLRAKLRGCGIKYVVAKNTMINRACQELGIEGLEQYLEGPTAIAFANDPVILAKTFTAFIKEAKKTQIKAGLLGSQAISATDIEALAKLPPKEVLLAQVLGMLQSPLAGFAGVTSGMLRQLVTVTDQLRQQREAQA